MVPIRHEGKLAIDGDTGLVFVLLPGGKFLMGAKPLELGIHFAVTTTTKDHDYLVIRKIEPNSLASELALQEGDQLVGMNSRPIRSTDDVQAVIKCD